jgi:hypothetical protein
MEIAMIKLKNIKYLFIVDKWRGITVTLHGHHQEISGNFIVCRQLSYLLVYPLENDKIKNHKYETVKLLVKY